MRDRDGPLLVLYVLIAANTLLLALGWWNMLTDASWLWAATVVANLLTWLVLLFSIRQRQRIKRMRRRAGTITLVVPVDHNGKRP